MKVAKAEVVRAPKGDPLDKIKRFNWEKIQDKPGTFEWIEKDELYVDQSYQRTRRHENRINKIASSWRWAKCGAILVAIRDDKWWVIDGGTRVSAALKRSDIKKLPCLVFDLGDDVSLEADTFVGVNDGKSAVPSYDRFKALIVAGDKCATKLNELFKSTGHKPSLTGGVKSIQCLMTIWNLFKKDEELITRIWPLLADTCLDCQMTNQVVRSIFWTEHSFKGNGNSLLNNPYRTFLINQTGLVITKEVRKEVSLVGMSGSRVEANALIKFINKSRIKGMAKLRLIE